MARVEFSEVTKEFADGVRAVENMNLRIADGEFVVLVGPSGCGKTTALRMTAGLEAISEGTISIGDRVVNDVPSSKRDIAMVFQNYALYPHMSVFENMAFGLQQQRLPKKEIERRVREIAHLLELDQYLSRHEIGTTTIYVTHDQVEAMTMGDRVAVLRNGVLQQVATPRALYHRPANVFVAEFIGSPAMNLFEVPVDHGPELVLDNSARVPAPAWAAQQLSGLSRVVVGIRPEDLHIDGDEGGLQANVESVEDLGAEMIVHMEAESAVVTFRHMRELADELDDPRLGSGFRRIARTKGDRVRLVARVAATVRVRERERLQLSFDPERIHLFDVESGVALERPDDDDAGDERSPRSVTTGPSLVEST